jgi:hypothetical protein
MEEGEIEEDSIEPIGLLGITPQLARESGFLGVIDLLKVAKHGKGENIYNDSLPLGRARRPLLSQYCALWQRVVGIAAGRREGMVA